MEYCNTVILYIILIINVYKLIFNYKNCNVQMTLKMQSFVDRIQRVIFQSLANCYLFVIYFKQIAKP